MAIEHLRIRPPSTFDPNNATHVGAVVHKVEQSEKYGTGWEFSSYDADSHELVLQRRSAMTSVAASTNRSDSFDVSLGGRFKPNEGVRAAAELEAQPQFKEGGYRMTEFNVHLDTAKMTRMTDDEYRCREAVAVALGAQPWDVQVKKRKGGGFLLKLPPKYVAAKHDKALQAIAEDVIGRFGWYVEIDQRNLTGEIIPSDPPTFPATINYPFASRDATRTDGDWLWKLPIGERLGGNGEPNEPLFMDFDGQVACLLNGTAGSGKSVLLNSIIFGAFAKGWDVAVVDEPSKNVDFLWMRDYVTKPHMWGCGSTAATVATLSEIVAEHDRRAKLLAEHGVQKIQDLPENIRPKPMLLVMDEITALFTPSPVPKGLPKDHPMRVTAEQEAMERGMIQAIARKLPAVYRFTGLRVIFSSQISQANTGIDSTFKTNMPIRLLAGVSATANQRGHVLANPDLCPEIPINLKEDKSAGRGSYVYEAEGTKACVGKSYFASTEQYLTELKKMRHIRVCDTPEPTVELILKHVPQLDEDAGFSEPKKVGFGHGPRTYEEWELDEEGRPLTGFQRANAAKHQSTVNAHHSVREGS